MSAVVTKKVKSLAQGGPSKLTTILSQLNAKPRLSLPGVKSLKLTYAYRNDHFGARHFAKEDLPRIRWANPDMEIHVERPNKTKEEQWKPELEVSFENGQSKTFDLQDKHSSTILLELMDTAGGKPWAEHKAASLSSGTPLLPSLDSASSPPSSSKPKKSTSEGVKDLPSFQSFKATHPDAGKPKPITTTAPPKKAAGSAAAPVVEGSAASPEAAAPAS